jgi:hypothetical protein
MISEIYVRNLITIFMNVAIMADTLKFAVVCAHG